MSDPYVFVSYSRKDRAFVERLTETLSAAGVHTWTDVSKIEPGQNWQTEIEKGLVGAAALLYVASENTSESKWIEYELGAFLKNGKVIPVIIDEAGERTLPEVLRTVEWVDFRGNFDDAARKLTRAVGVLRQDAPIARSEQKSKGYIFISYAEEDGSFVDDLKEHMKMRGYGYWDFRENRRNYQIDYTIELENVINGAEATLSVISPDWKKSSTCLKELHFSEDVNKPVFRLRVRDPGPTLALAGMTILDFTRERDVAFQKLDAELSKFGL
jgi:hypothetical protein